ncbi:protein phosphatase 1G-like [Clytia hemisphaerica]|uniref:protein-serine/threonine phosphatase n=1 Tax=Clytia hemisphaerica TaxID=252671 RepID=A0A7M5WWL9_9CNID
MGAYLPKPVTEKTSHDESLDHLSFGISGMQGWRENMEDAHCAMPDFDGKNNALFGVFDGHGGEEVAVYVSQNLHKFILDCDSYMEGEIESALKEAFMNIDQAVTTEEVIEELKEIAGFNEGNEEERAGELNALLEEAHMPIEDILANIQQKCQERLSVKGVFKDEEESEDEEEDEEKPKTENVVDENKNVNGHTEVPKETGKKSRKQKAPTKRVENGNTEIVAINGSAEKVKEEGGSSGGSSSTPSAEEAASADGSKSAGGSGGSSTAEESAGGSSGKSGSSSGGSSGGSSKAPYIPAVNPDGGEDDDEDDEDNDDPDFDSPPEDSDEAESSGDDDEDGSGESGEEDDDEDQFQDSEGYEFSQGQEVGKDSGTTAVVALIHNKKLYVANAGDSRCILCRNGKVVEMSKDHSPDVEEERKRIEAAGSKICSEGRINGGINLTRAVGDHAYKQNKDLPPEEQAVTALPDVRVQDLTDEDEFMVLACDGIWNVMTNDEVLDFVRDRITANEKADEKLKLSQICEEMFDHCLAPDTQNDGTGCDNMTCMVIQFKKKFLQNGHSTASNKRELSHSGDEESKQKSKKSKLS